MTVYERSYSIACRLHATTAFNIEKRSTKPLRMQQAFLSFFSQLSRTQNSSRILRKARISFKNLASQGTHTKIRGDLNGKLPGLTPCSMSGYAGMAHGHGGRTGASGSWYLPHQRAYRQDVAEHVGSASVVRQDPNYMAFSKHVRKRWIPRPARISTTA